MVCVFCLLSDLLDLTDLKHESAKSMASFPDSLITAMAPAPDGVAKATMVS